MILKNKSNFWIMLDFNPISYFKSYLKFYMLDRVVLYMDQKLKESLSTFMLRLKHSSAFKDVKFCLEVEMIVLSKSHIHPSI